MSEDGGILLRALIGPGIVVAIFGLLIAAGKLESFRKAHPSPLFRPLDLLPAALGWGFLAMMLAVAGGAVYPPIVAVPAAPLVCESGIEVRSQAYSYKPGQQGISRRMVCAGAEGEPGDVTIAAIAAATLVYTLAGLAFSILLSGLHRLRRDAPERTDGL